MLEVILKNEFVVMAVDAMLHLGSVFVLGIIVILATKLLSRGFVDAKLFMGLLIATLLVIVRVFLMNNLGVWLPGVGGILAMILIVISLYLSCFILVYKLISIPLLGTVLSSTVIVFAQMALANYIPVLSLKLMPEGQRFAEYAGIANERTKALMEEAKAYQGQSGGIRKILADAAEALNFFASDEERENLSRDFASGIALYRERKAYMDNMTPEELASYRRAMSAFLQEQGLSENRYSLSNLKNARPEDLENLANFMKDMNAEYGFTDELPQGRSEDGEEPPPSAESLAKIAQSLSNVSLSSDEMSQLGSLFTDLGINTDMVMAEMAQTRDDLDLDDIEELTTAMVGDLRHLIPEDMEVPSIGGSVGDYSIADGVTTFADDTDTVITSSGYRIRRVPTTPNASSIFIDERTDTTEPSMVSEEVSYFMPESANAIPSIDFENDTSAGIIIHEPLESVVIDNYFKPAQLAPIATEQSVFLIPTEAEENERWRKASEAIRIDAWFAGSSPDTGATIFVEGAGYRDGEIIEKVYAGETYFFRFDGKGENQVTLIALERLPQDFEENQSE